SQGLRLSEPVRIGDWEHLSQYFLTALAMQYFTGRVLEQPITLDQPVYLPGNERQGVWASPLLETVFGPEPKGDDHGASGGIRLRGDLGLIAVALGELRRSYQELPIRLLCRLAFKDRVN